MSAIKNNPTLLNSREMKLLKKIGYVVLVATILVYFVLVFQFCRSY